MKKILVAVVFILIGSIAFWSYKSYFNTKSKIASTSDIKEFDVTLTLDYGQGNINSYNVKAKQGDTAFSILRSQTEKQGIYLETIQYDFGVFVKKIGDLESGTDKSWIYYVNDVSGDKASDQYYLKENDKVLWKYEALKY